MVTFLDFVQAVSHAVSSGKQVFIVGHHSSSSGVSRSLRAVATEYYDWSSFAADTERYKRAVQASPQWRDEVQPYRNSSSFGLAGATIGGLVGLRLFGPIGGFVGAIAGFLLCQEQGGGGHQRGTGRPQKTIYSQRSSSRREWIAEELREMARQYDGERGLICTP